MGTRSIGIKTDANHKEISDEFRKLGWSVHDTHEVGGGFSDIVVGQWAHNYLVEIKDGSKPESKQQLNDKEKDFHKKWKGEIVIIRNKEQVHKFTRLIYSRIFL